MIKLQSQVNQFLINFLMLNEDFIVKGMLSKKYSENEFSNHILMENSSKLQSTYFLKNRATAE